VGEFHCDGCGKRFRWRVELVGKRLRCPCGAEVQCPEHPEGEYDFAPQAPVAVEAVAPVKPSVPTLAYRTPPAAKGGPIDTEILKNQHIPLWLLGGGAVIESVAAFWVYGGDLSKVMAHIIVAVGIDTTLMLFGVLLAAKIRGIHIGSFWNSVLKLAAILFATAALGDLMFPIAMLIPFLGWVVVQIVQFILYFALLGALFDLEESDTWYFVWVIFLIDLGFFVLMHWVPWH
jgi:hypothetical protein